MSKISWKGSALIAPVPCVMVTSGSCEKPNVMTVGWTGITCTKPAKTYISVRKSRYSYNLIKESGEFAINLTSSALVRAADFCGVRSGKDVNKFEKCSLTPERAEKISVPLIAESPVSLECRVTDIIELGSHDMFLADIVAVNIRDDLLDEDGRLALERADLIAYSHGEYYTLGKRLGKFGYSVEKKSTRARRARMQKSKEQNKKATPDDRS